MSTLIAQVVTLAATVMPAPWRKIELAYTPETVPAALGERAHKPPALPAIVGRRRREQDFIVIVDRFAAPRRDCVRQAHPWRLIPQLGLIATGVSAPERHGVPCGLQCTPSLPSSMSTVSYSLHT